MFGFSRCSVSKRPVPVLAHLDVCSSPFLESGTSDLTRNLVCSVFWLQNKAGRAKWGADRDKVEALKEAFKPKTELNPHGLQKTGAGGELVGACFKCGEEGHWSKECPNEANEGGSDEARGEREGERGTSKKVVKKKGVVTVKESKVGGGPLKKKKKKKGMSI